MLLLSLFLFLCFFLLYFFLQVDLVVDVNESEIMHFKKKLSLYHDFFFRFLSTKIIFVFLIFFSAFLSLLWWPMSVYGHIFFFRKVFEKPLLLYEIEIITKDNLKIIIMQFFFHHFLFQIINNKRNYKL